MRIEIVDAKSMGVRSHHYPETLPDRRMAIDAGLPIDCVRSGLLPPGKG